MKAMTTVKTTISTIAIQGVAGLRSPGRHLSLAGAQPHESAIRALALSKLPGTLFFPVLGCSVVLLDNLSAHFFWGEHLSRPAIAGVGIAILALALVI